MEDQKATRSCNPDHPIADYACFLQAWRTECPWLVVCKSVSMFTKCGLCEYLKLLVEQTPRDQGPLRETLRTRLGQHFAFQAAQRLAQGRLEEEAQQSQGRKWFMKIDKMDQNKTVTPTIWSQLCTPLFKDLDKRLVTGLICSMWHGTCCCTPAAVGKGVHPVAVGKGVGKGVHPVLCCCCRSVDWRNEHAGAHSSDQGEH